MERATDTRTRIGDTRSSVHVSPETGGLPKIAGVLTAHRGEHHVIVLQDFPDPDAIATGYVHQLLSAEYDITADVVYGERISHRQNVALVKLLNIGVKRLDPATDLTQYNAAVFVDNQGTTATRIVAALEKAGVPALIIVDHHELQGRLVPEFSDIRRTGATSTIYTGYLEQGVLELNKSQREHVMAATALMHGILTDTNGYLRADVEDFHAAGYLSRFSDPDLLESIMSQARSKSTMDLIQRALADRVVAESFSIAGIGYLRQEDRDAIPQAADFLLTEENVHTAIVYGIVVGDTRDDERLIGSMRTSKITLDPDEFIKEVFGRDSNGYYFGGGKSSAGGFEIQTGFLAGGTENEYRDLKWQIYDRQIKQRIFDKIGLQQRSSG